MADSSLSKRRVLTPPLLMVTTVLAEIEIRMAEMEQGKIIGFLSLNLKKKKRKRVAGSHPARMLQRFRMMRNAVYLLAADSSFLLPQLHFVLFSVLPPFVCVLILKRMKSTGFIR
ncbi:uncharacterized protein DS421_2g58950 [Arachis hypogaea]|nr:uncharacterized protein DS421_2g58950 [Arachis hypogaea]